MSESVTQKLIQEQLVWLKNLLKPLVDGSARSPHVDYVLTKDDLDRQQADEEDKQQIVQALSDYKDEKIAAACQAMHESQRIRRDVLIARPSHKRLMEASVRTAYNKRVQLEYLAKGMGKKKDNQ